jgi:hypothetical protein
MSKHNVIALENRQTIADPLTKMLREGATASISQVVEAELVELLRTH